MSGAATTSCPSCGYEDRGERDFCAACGAYLRWSEDPANADTAVLTPLDMPAVPEPEREPPTVAMAPAPPSPPPLPPKPTLEPVLITLSVAGVRALPGTPPTVSVEPGGHATLTAAVRNQSGIVDGFELHVRGVPAQWCTVTPQTLDLVPFGAENGSPDGEATIFVRPPHSPEARAGHHSIQVVAISRSSGDVVASAPAALVVGSYERFECRIRPERARGKRTAKFAVPVRNLGNAPLALEFYGEDADGEVRFTFQPPRLEVGVGEEGHSIVTVSARQPRTGRERERRLTIHADGAQQSLSGNAVFVQRARFTKGRLTASRVLIGLIAVALIALSSFTNWTDDGLKGLCLNGDESTCLRYDTFMDIYAGDNPLPVPNDDPGALFDLVTSAGMITLALGLLTLIGLRRGGLAWFSGIVSALFAILLLIAGGAGTGPVLLLIGGILAIVAGLSVQR